MERNRTRALVSPFGEDSTAQGITTLGNEERRMSEAHTPFESIVELNDWYRDALEGLVRNSATLVLREGASATPDAYVRLQGQIESAVVSLGEVYRTVYTSMAGEEPRVISPERVIELCNSNSVY